MKVKEIYIKSAIIKSKLPDADYVINPYIGCQHGCIYCYATFIKRFYGHINDRWGDFVDVKLNAPDKLKINKKHTGKTILIGSVTDPYQPIEKKYEVTKRILEKIDPTLANIEIITKSTLITRDINILQKLKNVKVGVSISTTDKFTAKLLEPNAPSPLSRIETLRKLKDAGVRNYLFVSPIFPFITDHIRLINTVKSFVDEIYFENLNIRGCNHNKILSFIKKYDPTLIECYQQLNRIIKVWNRIRSEITQTCDSLKVKYRIYFDH